MPLAYSEAKPFTATCPLHARFVYNDLPRHPFLLLGTEMTHRSITMRTAVLLALTWLLLASIAATSRSQDPFETRDPSDPFGGVPGNGGDPFGNSPADPVADMPATTTEPSPTNTPAPPTAPESVAVTTDDAEQPEGVSGTISRVTLYRDQALVTREITISEKDKSGVIAINSLPEMLIPDSVFAEGDDNIAIHGVRITSRPTTSSDREEVRAIELEIAENQALIAAVEQELQISRENLDSLGQLANFSATKSSEDLNRGVLDANTLMEVSKYLMDQRRQIMTEQLAGEQRLTKLREELGLLQRQLAEITASSGRNRYEAKVFVDVRGAGTVRLSYQVSGCGWTPQYAIRGNVDGEQFNIRYSAIVQQLSGEDWNQVALTLSTASPSVSATGPTLAPFRVTPVADQNDQPAQAFGQDGNSPQQLSERVQSIKKQQRFAENSSYSKQNARGELQRDMTLNSLAAEMQQLELEAEAKTAARLAADADDEVATQVYQLEQTVSLQSRRQQQLVQISDMQLPGDLYHVATPLLSSYAYREAEINNNESIGLLGGVASVYLDDRFVGRCELPTTASGQKLVVGFGADQQIRIRRELRDKKDVLRGGNRNLEFTYRLVVANFKDKPVQVRLYDRIPVAAETRDVLVNVSDTSQPLSDDGLYLRIARDKGILRWDLEIPASRHGENAFDVEYTYNLDFDKNRVLGIEGLAQQTNADLFYQRNSGGGMGGMGGMGGYPGNQAPATSSPSSGH